jgi:hypothetical protein
MHSTQYHATVPHFFANFSGDAEVSEQLACMEKLLIIIGFQTKHRGSLHMLQKQSEPSLNNH